MSLKKCVIGDISIIIETCDRSLLLQLPTDIVEKEKKAEKSRKKADEMENKIE